MKKDPLSPISNNNKEESENRKTNDKLSPANKMMMNWLKKGDATKKPNNSETDKKRSGEATEKAEKSASNLQFSKVKEEKKSSSDIKIAKTSPKEHKISSVTKQSPTSSKSKSSKSNEASSSSSNQSKKSTSSTKQKEISSPTSPVVEKKTASKLTKKITQENEEKKTSNDSKLNKSGNEPKKPANKFYAAYMRREGPKNPGSKKIPIGNKDCFNGLKFLISGVLDSIERDECKSIIEKYGGSIISGVTKKLDYLIVGSDAGQSKIEKAQELKIKQINEDEFLDLICTKSGIKNPKYEEEDQPMMDEELESEEMEIQVVEKKEVKEEPKSKKPKLKLLDESLELIEDDVDPKLAKEVTSKKSKTTAPSPLKEIKKSPIKKEVEKISQTFKSETVEPKLKTEISTQSQNIQNELWVEKHKPQQVSKIIGQGTEKSNASKLLNWLKNWNNCHLSGSENKPKKSWNDQDSGSSFKAALLSGPPGVGKTTTATLVCKEAGYTFIELNASDSRSKKLLDKILGESSDNCSMDSYLQKSANKSSSSHKPTDLNKDKHCIIMDEVDGMAGNEDRGGILELINTVKSSKIPIICICNDRQHIKIRSLANYCFDLRFYKPRLEQVRAGLLSVCFKEKIKATPDVLDQIIVGCNYDIRQCLNNLSMWSSNNKNLTTNQQTKSDIEKAMKDIRMNPFEACKQVFQIEQNSNKPQRTMNDKMDFFFTDYSLMPLLVHENYLSVKPTNLKGNNTKQKAIYHLEMLNESIESMCHSDRIGRLIRTNNNWSLLPSQAIFATVVPGEKLTGSIGLPAFPSWFGKHSKKGRVDRILQELQKHMRMKISANKIGVGMEYLDILKDMLSKPLIKNGTDGIPKVLEIMKEYNLTRDDFDTILELSTWPNQKNPNPITLIDSKVKASFTRAYNKEAHKNPFSIVNFKKIKGVKTDDLDIEMEDEDVLNEVEDEEDKDDITADAMIKVNTKKKAPAKSSTALKRNIAETNDTASSKPASKKKKT